MNIVVLPYNAAEGTPPAIGRQLANYISEIVRGNSEAEVHAVSYLTQMEDEGQQRSMFVNVADTLLERDWLNQMFDQPQAEGAMLMDGLVKLADGKLEITTRFNVKNQMEPIYENTETLAIDQIFEKLRSLIGAVGQHAEIEIQNGIPANLEFGTTSGQAFLDFLEGYDALMYLQQANGAVTPDFSPEYSLNKLLAAIELDKEFVGPFDTLVNLARACGQFRVGTFDVLKSALEKAEQLVPEDFKPQFALGELYMGVNEFGLASSAFEKAISKESEEPALYTRLGMAQASAGMPINAERNFRRAMELEGPDKPSADFLANILVQTNREHEVPGIWQSVVEEDPQNGSAHAKLAIALIRTGKAAEGEKVFESALETLDDNMIVKRWYAPYLANEKNDLDRAMDFYEDCIDHLPSDISVQLEYAQTLKAADREFEIPNVLKQVLGQNPEPNVRAETLAWLIELEQPKRAESVEEARKKFEEGQSELAVRELKPLRNWMGDYWKLWALLSSALNATGEYAEAEEAAGRLIQLYPGCEPAYGEFLNALAGQDKHEEAYNFMRFAVTQFPQSLAMHLNLALAAKRSGRSDEAKGIATQIREVVGNNAEIEPVLQEIEG